MNSLPTDLENIIINNINGIEHKERFNNTLNIINNIEYRIIKEGEEDDDGYIRTNPLSYRDLNNNTTISTLTNNKLSSTTITDNGIIEYMEKNNKGFSRITDR